MDVKDYILVLKGRPWSILGHLLSLQIWEECMVLKDVNFDVTPFWVQFHGLPMETFNCRNAKTLGDTVGETVLFKNPIMNGKLGRGFVRVRTLVSTNVPLTTGFWVPRDQKEPAWVTVKYERLQNFGYKCGCTGHGN